MNPVHSNAIAEFLKQGGTVAKAQNVMPVTAREVVDYLVSCGISAKYSPDGLGAYKYEGKRCNLAKLIELTNIHRAARLLPPFAVRVNICVGARRTSA